MPTEEDYKRIRKSARQFVWRKYGTARGHSAEMEARVKLAIKRLEEKEAQQDEAPPETPELEIYHELMRKLKRGHRFDKPIPSDVDDEDERRIPVELTRPADFEVTLDGPNAGKIIRRKRKHKEKVNLTFWE